ncbi:UNVERIFIED_CONTAM: DUF2515 family protein [Halobacillus marinus]|uniref:DUF2515 family protein n=1 Tax=Bacillus sp. SB49 TaxID=1071080 RepID=UPI0004244B18|nr:DUF2515 family protein [Bacillus sp. SB49]QHT47065.1 DUF2515 domain-containing protein [Bacillus sp. SB49]
MLDGGRWLKKQLKQTLKAKGVSHPLSMKDKEIIEAIRKETVTANRNNCTRTAAYFQYYRNNPEMHWSLLAHLVSRNAGWNMTDLKGEYLPVLLSGKEQVDFFVFLERGNWLIFQDAYPQLLLYQYSRQIGRPLFHLLAPLGISAFMLPFWEKFWDDGNSERITKALIVNEQMYIEERVVQNHQYMQTVTDKVMFKLQDILDFNHILFPYETPNQKKTKLIGGTVHHFSAVDARVFFGKSLYHTLFSVKSRLEQITAWSEAHVHSGSRSDYWPDLFSLVKETPPGKVHELLESPCRRKHKGPKIYSPPLEQAWEDWTHQEAEPGDWFRNLTTLRWMKAKTKELDEDIESSYCRTIEEVEMAVTAKNTFKREEEA